MRCCVADQPGRTCPFGVLMPYLVGAGIGVLSWVVFAVVNQPIGMSTALSQVSGAVATLVWASRTRYRVRRVTLSSPVSLRGLRIA